MRYNNRYNNQNNSNDIRTTVSLISASCTSGKIQNYLIVNIMFSMHLNNKKRSRILEIKHELKIIRITIT